MSWLLKNRKRTLERKNSIDNDLESGHSDYRAVKITPGRKACESANLLSEEIFLCNQAPFLPLDACKCRDNCKCRYTHFPDRRQYGRREVDNGFAEKLFDDERRARQDRRQSPSLESSKAYW